MRCAALSLLLLGASACGPELGERPHLAVDPDQLFLPGALAGRTAHATLSLLNLGAAPLVLERLEVTPAGSSFRLDPGPRTPATLEAGEVLEVRVAHVAREGSATRAELEVASSDPEVPRTRVELRAPPTAPVLSLVPLAVDFGAVRTATTAQRTVRLTNVGRATARHLAARVLGSTDFSSILSATELAAGEQVDVTVGYAPRGGDADLGTLELSWGQGRQEIGLRGRQDLAAPD